MLLHDVMVRRQRAQHCGPASRERGLHCQCCVAIVRHVQCFRGSSGVARMRVSGLHGAPDLLGMGDRYSTHSPRNGVALKRPLSSNCCNAMFSSYRVPGPKKSNLSNAAFLESARPEHANVSADLTYT